MISAEFCHSCQVGGYTVTFTTDSIHISRLPRHLRDPDQQLAVFAEQLAPHSPEAATACQRARSSGNGNHATATLNGSSSSSSCSYAVTLSACFTYTLPDAPRARETSEGGSSAGQVGVGFTV